MSDQLDKTPLARWKNLREKGKVTAVNVESHDLIAEKPSWFEEEKFKFAKEMVQKYYIGCSFSSFTGLLLILQLPEGLEPLLSTGNSKDIPSLYRRYLNTIIHVQSWHETDVFDKESKGYKSIRQVRGMHKRVQALMNEKFKVKDQYNQDRIWYNQYDVALTQFAFIGLAMLWPKKNAMVLATDKELEGLNYYWRVMGWFMGVSDEFNCCQFDIYKDIKEFNRLIFEHEFKEAFKNEPCDLGLEMTKSICVALQYYVPLVTFNSLAYWWQDCFEFNGYKVEPMTTKEKLINWWTGVSFNRLFKNESFLRFSNRLQKKRFETRLKNKDKIYEKLKEQYKDNEKLTYYSTRVDYFNKEQCKEEPLVDDKTMEVVGSAIEKANQELDEEAERQRVLEKAAGCPFGYVSKLSTTNSSSLSPPTNNGTPAVAVA